MNSKGKKKEKKNSFPLISPDFFHVQNPTGDTAVLGLGLGAEGTARAQPDWPDRAAAGPHLF